MSATRTPLFAGAAVTASFVFSMACSDGTEDNAAEPSASNSGTTGQQVTLPSAVVTPSAPAVAPSQPVAPTGGNGTGMGMGGQVQPGPVQPSGAPNEGPGGAPSVQPVAPLVSPPATVGPTTSEPQTGTPPDTTAPVDGTSDDGSNDGETAPTGGASDTSAPTGAEGSTTDSDPSTTVMETSDNGETDPGMDTSAVSPDDTSEPVSPAEEPGPTEDIDCPADATFCTGFELATLPAEASFEPKHIADMLAGNVFDGTQMALDSQNVYSGSQSLHVPAGSGGYEYRMLAVPVPAGAFWVRLYVRTSTSFGDGSHDTLYMGSRLPKGEYNGDTAVEISEQSMQLLLNTKDSLYAASGPGDPAGSGASGPVLPANTWICMETRFDSNAIEVYADGELLIQASNYGGQESYQTFRFGYLSFNDARGVWYDDVAVAPTRIGCN